MSNQFSWVTRFLEQPHLIVAPVALLLLAVFTALAVGHGEFATVSIVVGGMLVVGLTLMLGRDYWLLIPFAFSADLPAIPVAGRLVELGEAAIVVCSLVFFIRYALRQQTFTLFRLSHTAVLMFAAWAMFIFWENPVWLTVASGELGGARFYAKIVMALAAFLIMANQRISQREAQWVLILTLIGTVLASAHDIASYFIPAFGGTAAVAAYGLGGAVAGSEVDSFYSWHQHISAVPSVIIILMLSRYRSREIFSLQKIWMPILFVVCAALVLLSGKRAAAASVPIFAVAAAVMRKEYGYLTLWVGGAAAAGMLLVAGQGTLFHLPLTAQRSLSWLPGQWDSEIQSTGGEVDVFRSTLRRLAWEKIQRDPWVGQGYRVDLALIQQSMDIGGGGTEGQVLPFAMGSAWHNTWLGYAADLGIPAAVFAGLIFLTFITMGWRLSRHLPLGSMSATLAAYITLRTIVNLLSSHTSGHSALDAFGRWWMFGILVSLAVQAAKDKEARALAGDDGSPGRGATAAAVPAGLAPLGADQPRRSRLPTSVGR